MARIKISLEDFEKITQVGSCARTLMGSLHLLSEPNFLKAYDNLTYLRYRWAWETPRLKEIVNKLIWLMERNKDKEVKEYLEELTSPFIEDLRVKILDCLTDFDILKLYEDIFDKFYNVRKDVCEGLEILLRYNKEDRETLLELGYDFIMIQDSDFLEVYYLFKDINNLIEFEF